MKNCNDESACSGRREFLVKATATTGGLLLSLASAGALPAQTKEPASQTTDEDLIVRLDEKSGLNRAGGSEIVETKAGKIIIVRNSDMSLSAFSAKCTHKGGPISYDAKTGQLECAWHHSKFDPKTGSVLSGPAKEPLPAYSTENAVVIDLKAKA